MTFQAPPEFGMRCYGTSRISRSRGMTCKTQFIICDTFMNIRISPYGRSVHTQIVFVCTTAHYKQ